MRRELLDTIPDLPRWVELRSALLEDDVRVFGPPGACAVVVPDDRGQSVFLVGVPERDVLRAAASTDPTAEVIFYAEALDALGDRSRAARRVVVFSLPHQGAVITGHPTIVLGPDDGARLEHVPADLREELDAALTRVPVVAALAGDVPASFCYPGAMTETLWDVSIDTLESHQRQGLAAAAAARVITMQDELGRRPVWQAEETNLGSMMLARKLGFEPVDELFLWQASELLDAVRA